MADAESVSVLLAGRRLSDNPRGAFRAVSGLILAIFVTSVSVGVISTICLITVRRVRTPSRAKPSPISSRSTEHSVRREALGAVVDSIDSWRERRDHRVRCPGGMKIDGPVPHINISVATSNMESCRARSWTRRCSGECRAGARYAALGDDVAFTPITKP